MKSVYFDWNGAHDKRIVYSKDSLYSGQYVVATADKPIIYIKSYNDFMDDSINPGYAQNQDGAFKNLYKDANLYAKQHDQANVKFRLMPMFGINTDRGLYARSDFFIEMTVTKDMTFDEFKQIMIRKREKFWADWYNTAERYQKELANHHKPNSKEYKYKEYPDRPLEKNDVYKHLLQKSLDSKMQNPALSIGKSLEERFLKSVNSVRNNSAADDMILMEAVRSNRGDEIAKLFNIPQKQINLIRKSINIKNKLSRAIPHHARNKNSRDTKLDKLVKPVKKVFGDAIEKVGKLQEKIIIDKIAKKNKFFEQKER